MKLTHNSSCMLSKGQITALVTLRVLIGWHLLYEGFSKLFNPYWTAASYLAESKWIFSAFFKWLASSSTTLTIVDFVNEWGLIAIGFALIVGCFTRTATISAIVLLFLYYIATPPLIGLTYSMPTEGSYLIVNKTLIELAALVVLAYFPTGNIIGLDVLISKKLSKS